MVQAEGVERHGVDLENVPNADCHSWNQESTVAALKHLSIFYA